jgi:hypothetical protein
MLSKSKAHKNLKRAYLGPVEHEAPQEDGGVEDQRLVLAPLPALVHPKPERRWRWGVVELVITYAWGGGGGGLTGDNVETRRVVSDPLHCDQNNASLPCDTRNSHMMGS